MKRTSVAILLLLVFVRLAHGATYYIDPTCQYNGDGTTPNCATADGGVGAFNTGMGIKINPNSTYLWKRGTVDLWDANQTSGKRMFAYHDHNIEFGAYGNGPNPIIREYSIAPSGNWTNDGGNIWHWDLPETSYNEPIVLGIGSLDVNATKIDTSIYGMEALDSWGDWDNRDYYNDGVNRLYIYSPDNPATFYPQIYYTTVTNTIIAIEQSDNITIHDLQFEGGRAGVSVIASDDNYTNLRIYNCTFKYCYRGIFISSGTDNKFINPKIYHNRFYSIGETPIYVSGSPQNAFIYDNEIYDSGKSVTIAGIYIAGSHVNSYDDGTKIFNNRCYRYRQGRYYLNDGSCYYVEENSNYATIYNNWCYDADFCIIDHSSVNVTIYNNVSINCKCGLRSAQSADYGTAVKEIYNNTFAQCGTSGPLGTVDYGFCVRLWAPSTNSFIFRNNIINVTVPTQVAIEIGPQSWSAITESNNAIYGSYTHRFWQSTNGEKSLTNPVLADVGLKTYVIDRNSPAVDAGVKVPIREADVLGHKIVDGKPDIGAYEALSVPTPSETPILF